MKKTMQKQGLPGRRQGTVLCLFILFFLCMFTTGAAGASQGIAPGDSGRYEGVIDDLTRQLIFAYPESADGEKSRVLLRELRNVSPERSMIWEKLLDYWDEINRDDFVNVVPGSDPLPLYTQLPEDNSLCIVILGFALNPDGSMKEELIERLKLGLSCAGQYPNAYVLVTGGATAAGNKNTSEADRMAEWLIKNAPEKGVSGISERLIMENASLTTQENARLSIAVLEKEYPQIRNLVIVTSDYHVPLGCLLFESQCLFSGMDDPTPSQAFDTPDHLQVIANAGCHVPGSGVFSESVQARALWSLYTAVNEKQPFEQGS